MGIPYFLPQCGAADDGLSPLAKRTLRPIIKGYVTFGTLALCLEDRVGMLSCLVVTKLARASLHGLPREIVVAEQ
jgi:hypothetical protein